MPPGTAGTGPGHRHSGRQVAHPPQLCGHRHPEHRRRRRQGVLPGEQQPLLPRQEHRREPVAQQGQQPQRCLDHRHLLQRLQALPHDCLCRRQHRRHHQQRPRGEPARHHGSLAHEHQGHQRYHLHGWRRRPRGHHLWLRRLQRHQVGSEGVAHLQHQHQFGCRGGRLRAAQRRQQHLLRQGRHPLRDPGLDDEHWRQRQRPHLPHSRQQVYAAHRVDL